MSILEKKIQQKFICLWETFFPDFFSFNNILAKKFSNKWLKYISNLIFFQLKPLSLFLILNEYKTKWKKVIGITEI